MECNNLEEEAMVLESMFDTSFEIKRNTVSDTMEKVLGTLEVGQDPFAIQKELIKKFADESIKK